MRPAVLRRNAVLSAFSVIFLRFSSATFSQSTIPAIAKYFGTKGRYEEVNPYLIDDILSVNKSLSKPPSSDCRAIHLTAVIRHGTRFPTSKNIRKIKNLHSLVINEAKDTHTWLRDIKTNWEMWYTEDMDGKLVEKGRNDHRHLAVRLATSFPTLISKDNFQNNRMKFITSSKHRCVDSVEAFQEGLHRLWNIKDTSYSHENNDNLMRFFDQCKKFIENVENNKTALQEVDLFKSSDEMKKLQKRIADRLEIPHNHMTTDMVEAAFFLCSYEFSIKSLNSPWCNLFDEADAQVLEYKNDLKQYWKRGYGHDINRKSSCTLFHDLFRRLDQAAYDFKFGHVTEAVTVQVGHAETLLPLLSLMGFFRDETQLTASNFHQQQGRTFRTSQIVPYAANLVFVLYECGEGLRLQFLLNEKPMTFPSIDQSAPLYRNVRNHYRDLLNGCNFEKECELSKMNRKNTEL
ncbi:multiple inositol polyphosphate phosphatase 1b [Alosa pseudoharengus]|uniref:multiple inositol polyphosphate phosphatase 1b n=1 Tax=Alosa pseudoharengus TaxID=34774 RepID=UPI003F886BEE